MSRLPDGSPETFHSLQGEGVTLGTPTVFLRLALCNLRCAWCDTKYTWDWEHYDHEREVVALSLPEVERLILRYGCPHLVITGGEPLLQQTSLLPLCRALKSRGFFIEVESNGTLTPGEELAGLVAQWNISPKTSNSGNSVEAREVADTLRFFSGLQNAYFKFVVDREDDLLEIEGLAATYQLPKERIVLMPQATSAETLLEKSRWLSAHCLTGGYRFSTRLHILLWGDKRGV